MCTILWSHGITIADIKKFAYSREKSTKPSRIPASVMDKYLHVFGVFLWVAARRCVFSSRKCEPARLISAAEWGSRPERCRVTAGSSRGTRCRWCRCCWIPWTARLPPSPRTTRCSDPPARPRIATPPRRRTVACRARRPVAWRKSCRCRCWSNWPRTPASWLRRAVPSPCRASRPDPGGARDPPEPPGRDNCGPSWPRKSRANGRQRSRNRVGRALSRSTRPTTSRRDFRSRFFPSRTPESYSARAKVKSRAPRGDKADVTFVRWDETNSIPADKCILDFAGSPSVLGPPKSGLGLFQSSLPIFSAITITNPRARSGVLIKAIHRDDGFRFTDRIH